MSHELATFLFFVAAIVIAYCLGVDVGRVTERARWNREVVQNLAREIADRYEKEVA